MQHLKIIKTIYFNKLVRRQAYQLVSHWLKHVNIALIDKFEFENDMISNSLMS